MSRGFKYKVDGKIVSEFEFARMAYDHAKSYDPETRSAYLKSIGSIISIRTMKNKFETFYGPILGTTLLLLVITLAIVNPFPSKFQTGTLWVALSLAAALSAALIPGFLEVKYKGAIKATGAIAVFVIMYFMSPDIIKEVNGKESNSPKLSLYWVKEDSSDVQNIVVDFDRNSNTRIADYAVTTLSSYYGQELSTSDFTCYRKSDGRIYADETCAEFTDGEIMLISNKVVEAFADKRSAFLHFSEKGRQ